MTFIQHFLFDADIQVYLHKQDTFFYENNLFALHRPPHSIPRYVVDIELLDNTETEACLDLEYDICREKELSERLCCNSPQTR